MIEFKIFPNDFDNDDFDFQRLWEKYNLEIIGYFNQFYPKRLDTSLEKKGYLQGNLLLDEVKDFKENIKFFNFDPFRNTSDLNFHSSDFEEMGIKESYERDSKFFNLNFEIASPLINIFNRIKEKIAYQLGSPWKVHMVRTWSTDSSANPENMYGWHTDGMPHEFFKIMFYFNPLDDNHGSLEITKSKTVKRFFSKSPGSWVLFKNSMVFHRGVPPKSKKLRLACEVTISRSFSYNLIPKNAGNSAHWPIAPWNNAGQYNTLTKKNTKREIHKNSFYSKNKICYNHFDKLNKEDKKAVMIMCEIYNAKK